MCKKRRERKKSKKRQKIMYEAVFALMKETLQSILDKENKDKTVKNDDGTMNYYLLSVKVKTEAAMALDYVDKLEEKKPLEALKVKK